MGFFAWITEGVRRAVVRGLEQAADDINASDGDVEISVRLPAYRERIGLPHEEPTSNGRKRKALNA